MELAESPSCERPLSTTGVYQTHRNGACGTIPWSLKNYPPPYLPTSSVSLDPLTSQNDHLRNVPPTVSRALTGHRLLP